MVLLFSLGLKAQELPQLQVIARATPEKVMLRWAVDSPLAWKTANTHGFVVERTTISRDNAAVLPLEKVLLTTAPLKPQPLEAWETLATVDQNAAVIAQALYGETFRTTAPAQGAMAEIFAVNQELEQRFTFALLAAEQNFEAAKLAGWGFEDTTARANERYLYTVSVALPEESNTLIGSGGVYASQDAYEALPKPIGLSAVFNDGQVALSWNFNLLQHLYTSYVVERSNDNTNFEPLNRVPIFNAQESNTAAENSLFFTDSIPNKTPFYYRVKGKTAFGETGPSSDVVQGEAKPALGFLPRITKKSIPNDQTAILEWEFDEKGNALITGFELRRASTVNGPFVTVQKDLPNTARSTTYAPLQRVNYFTIVALGNTGVESESYPSLVQPVDSIPPGAPKGLTGTLDTLGIARLTWDANGELDFGGYRVYRANSPDSEFTQITKTPLKTTQYTDTLAVNTLNKAIYYKLVAEDQRYNSSGFSAVLKLNRPDLVPPSPPVLKAYEVLKDGVSLQFIGSSSEDVETHTMYRKDIAQSQLGWKLLEQTFFTSDSTFVDRSLNHSGVYEYTMTATDGSGLESTPAQPITLNFQGTAPEIEDIKFTGTANRELYFINLTWRLKAPAVKEFWLYRGTDSHGLKKYKTLSGDTKSFNDTQLKVNTRYHYGLQAVFSDGTLTGIKKIDVNY